jgi:hypothetical protein
MPDEQRSVVDAEVDAVPGQDKRLALPLTTPTAMSRLIFDLGFPMRTS